MIISLTSWARIRRIIIYQELEKEKREYLNIQIFINQLFPEKYYKAEKSNNFTNECNFYNIPASGAVCTSNKFEIKVEDYN